MPTSPSIYLPHIDTIRRLCEEGKRDVEIAQLIPVKRAKPATIRWWRQRHEIYGPHSDTRKYPWDQWFDGEERTITRGKDFQRPVVNMQKSMHTVAKRRKGLVRTRTRGETITFTFTAIKAR